MAEDRRCTRPRRAAANHPGAGVAAAFHQAEHIARRNPHHGGQALPDGSGQARPPTPGRPRLDRDGVSGERPHAPLRLGQRAGDGHRTPSELRTGWGLVRAERARQREAQRADGERQAKREFSTAAAVLLVGFHCEPQPHGNQFPRTNPSSRIRGDSDAQVQRRKRGEMGKLQSKAGKIQTQAGSFAGMRYGFRESNTDSGNAVRTRT